MTTDAVAPWRAPLARALHRNRAQPFCRYLQLATVRSEGRPANRTVVFRGFLEGTNQLMFISDRRSEKIEQIRQNPQAEACWYFTKTREQFRLSGQLTVITAHAPAATASAQRQMAARDQLWQQISDSARLQFAWPPPQAPRAASEAFDPPVPDVQHPPDTFCLLLLDVCRVDHLMLRGDPQNRQIYQGRAVELSMEWTVTAVNP